MQAKRQHKGASRGPNIMPLGGPGGQFFLADRSDFGHFLPPDGKRNRPGNLCRWPDGWALSRLDRHFAFLAAAMPGATKIFRVPCHCSATVPVGLGQAGTSVTCPACGEIINVPRLRELAAFEQVDALAPKRVWRAGHAWLFVGGVMAVVGAAAAGLLSRFDGGASQRLPDEAVIRTAIDSADVVTVYKAWLAVKRSGVDRGAIADEVSVQRLVRSIGGVAMLLWVAAAVGAVIAVAGGIASVSRRADSGERAR